MDKVTVRGLVKRFGKMVAVNSISFVVRQGESVVLLGPSGCGKTTTLRAIAGFIPIDGGSVMLQDREISSPKNILPPEKRNMSMVFQNYAVWPHRTVFENVSYGLKIRKIPRDQIKSRVQRALDRVKLTGLEKRYPSELSGGQQQRVALARAIVIEPEVLLLDEPLSNLDALLRSEMRLELKELQKDLGVTSIYVTHDQHEAMVLADQLVVMNNGDIEQIGPPDEVYQRPSSIFVSNFLGVTNFLEGTIASVYDDYAEIVMEEGIRIKAVVSECNREKLFAGKKGCVSVRPVFFKIQKIYHNEITLENQLPGEIERRIFLGENYEYIVKTKTKEIKVRTLLDNLFHPGEQIMLTFNPSEGICLPVD